ncbi:MAG TPA: DNA primase [Candidatus Krumholzibacteria bacterium]|nr:DNA primase [Candidatus Krumholzibacteria bacterium]HPD71102.1 DNA primase [Candidatus Krumholzibacteria bacterium]HRY39198.1 DNA primase [Candidatus Krumholzibacteria bacterium]
MAVLPPEIIARVKDETDLVELVGRYVRLQGAGASYKGLCPFHREKTPSFHVNPARQSYKCFGCGEGGDAISFLMAVENLTFPEAMETLARSLDIDLAKFLQAGEDEGEKRAFHRANEAACELFVEAWHDPRLGAAARDYLTGRGFLPEVLDRFDVGWAPGHDWLAARLAKRGVSEDLAVAAGLLRRQEGRPAFAYFRERIMFPVRNIARQVAGFGARLIGPGEPKYLNSADSPHYSKGKLLYGFDSTRMVIARTKVAVLVEGYLDLIALAQAGVAHVVATCGTAFTAEQARLLRRGARKVVMLFDGDQAGRKAAVRSSHVCLCAGLEAEIAELPRGLDPADLVVSQGPEALQAVLRGAVGYLRFVREAVAQAGGDRAALEKGVHQVLTTIAEVPDAIRREYMLQEAAELFGLDVAILRDSLHGLKRGTPGRARATGEPEPEPAPSADGGEPAARRVRFRTLTGVRREHVEAVLLAHVLRDSSGAAVRLFAELGADLDWSTPAAAELAAELAAWPAAPGGDSPRSFVESRWHARAAGYRAYVTDLLERDMPEGGETERAVRESVARLRLARRVHQD